MFALTQIDPVRFEVIRNALTEATEEMAVALRRSAYSTNIKTRNDFSCAFFDRRLRVTAQAFSQPVHLGSFVELVPRAVKEYGPERLRPGDMLVVNDPYNGGVHLNDITVIAPVFCGGELFGYVANLAHHVDVGGGAPASVGAFREVFQEGVIIPVVRLVERDVIVKDVFRLIMAQIRSKKETAGDLRAQVAANVTGTRRLSALVDRIGSDTGHAIIDALIDYTHRRARAELDGLPRGTYHATGFVDNDGFSAERVQLRVSVIINDQGVLFDLSGSDPQRRAPVNSTFAQTFSACAYALKCLIDQDIPVNQGFYDLVRVFAPEGTVVNCRPPAPVVGGWETQTRLVDTILNAFAYALPHKVPAGSKAMMCHAGFGGVNPETGEYQCFLETLAGGYGGRAVSDGPDAVQTHGQNTENAPIEETEAAYPVRITRYELINDSEGPGMFRGGLGLRRDYLFPEYPVTFTILADRDREGPGGLFGGLPAPPAKYILNPDGDAKSLSSKTTVELQPGSVVSYRTCGGGGYGPPLARDPAMVLRDVRDGKVSASRAREIYGVVVDVVSWQVDVEATNRCRSRMTAENRNG